jgi:hypothetical protein
MSRATLVALVLIVAAAGAAPAQEPPPTGLQSEARFTLANPLSSNVEMARRFLSPLMAASMAQRLAKVGKALAEQPLDPAGETYALYVPEKPPPSGYGLLVFVPPWDGAHVPPGWTRVLERHGLIYVSAARSGNEESILGRRAPLALIAAANVMARYRVDPARVYVGGLSGGSRVALRIALAYPDVFRGALLNAGSDPIGGTDLPLPPSDLFAPFQTRTRLVYFTGGQDQEHLAWDQGSLASLKRWCVTGGEGQVIPGRPHEIADADAFERALLALETPARVDPDRQAACQAGLLRDVNDRLDKAEALAAAGRTDAARAAVQRIDREYGGLAAPRSVALEDRLGR